MRWEFIMTDSEDNPVIACGVITDRGRAFAYGVFIGKVCKHFGYQRNDADEYLENMTSAYNDAEQAYAWRDNAGSNHMIVKASDEGYECEVTIIAMHKPPIELSPSIDLTL